MCTISLQLMQFLYLQTMSFSLGRNHTPAFLMYVLMSYYVNEHAKFDVF